MTYWPTDSERFDDLHLDDGSSLLVMGEDLTNSPSNIPQIAEQHTGPLSHLLTYGGSLTGSQASFSRPPLFGKTKRWRSCEDYSCGNNPQECEGTSYISRTSGRYILEETADVIYVQSKARVTFNDSSLELVITLEQNMSTKIKILMLLRTHSMFNSFQYC